MTDTATLGVPVIETERCRLRAKTLEDFPFYRDLWADPEVTRFIGGGARSEEDTWAKFLRTAGCWKLLGYGYWALEEKSSGELIGQVGFGEFKRTLTPTLKGTLEIGWVLSPAAYGKGYASEAAQAAVRWGDEAFPGKVMSCIIDPAHAASIRVAEKCGFRETGRADYLGSEVVMMHRY